jgi:hypothetical protein
VPLLGVLPYDREVSQADRAGTGVAGDTAEALRRELDLVVSRLDRIAVGSSA